MVWTSTRCVWGDRVWWRELVLAGRGTVREAPFAHGRRGEAPFARPHPPPPPSPPPPPRANVHTLLTDVDVVFLRNPLPDLLSNHPHCSLLASLDQLRFSAREVAECGGRNACDPLWMNTGLMFFRHSNATVRGGGLWGVFGWRPY